MDLPAPTDDGTEENENEERREAQRGAPEAEENGGFLSAGRESDMERKKELAEEREGGDSAPDKKAFREEWMDEETDYPPDGLPEEEEEKKARTRRRRILFLVLTSFLLLFLLTGLFSGDDPPMNVKRLAKPGAGEAGRINLDPSPAYREKIEAYAEKRARQAKTDGQSFVAPLSEKGFSTERTALPEKTVSEPPATEPS
ncbi:MAG: hypothetical protein K5657_02950, partial [Desulfovibrio sp.]|nr:hypothetical protein [Desulfovibrio sp.]